MMKSFLAATAIAGVLTALALAQVPGQGNNIPIGGGLNGGGTAIGGCSNTQVFFNNAGLLGCDAGLTKTAGASGFVTIQSNILLGGANGTIQIPNGGTYIWGNGTKLTSSLSGVVQFQNNGNTQNFNLSTGAANLASFNGPIAGTGHQSTGVAFASLPATGAGTISYITDGLAANCGDTTCSTFGTTVTAGGGALKLLVWNNGTNWTLMGK